MTETAAQPAAQLRDITGAPSPTPRAACAGPPRSYNASHASESDGALRCPPHHRVRAAARGSPSAQARVKPADHRLPSAATDDSRGADHRLASLTDQPFPLPVHRPRGPDAGPAHIASARAAARPPRVARERARSAQRPRDLGRRCRPSVSAWAHRCRPGASPRTVPLGAAQGNPGRG